MVPAAGLSGNVANRLEMEYRDKPSVCRENRLARPAENRDVVSGARVVVVEELGT
ncbi:MAG: hypothetical protein GY765_16135 [bacterium]|nr:hypothetical protein [bacterium]